MYDRTEWLDHVTVPANCFIIADNGDGTVTITPAGAVMQQGTPQDQVRFNHIENGIVDAHLTADLLLNFARQNSWEKEVGTITLTNTAKYPFNNSQQSVPLAGKYDSDAYIVFAEITAFTGNAGEIEVVDKLENGFKIAFTGSASSVTLKYTVVGGYLK
jgi:hypothetical protein